MLLSVRSDGAILQPREPQSQFQDPYAGRFVSPENLSQAISAYDICDNKENTWLEILEMRDGRYCFVVELFRLWILKNYSV